MAIKGLSELNVGKIRKAYLLGHEIFKSISGWPTCTIYRPVRRDSARGNEGEVIGIEYVIVHKEVEFDMDQITTTAVAGVERRAADITFTFYDFFIPDGDYHIAFGEWEENIVSTTGKGRWGPKCPICSGYGKYVSGVNWLKIKDYLWNNPHGDVKQCGYCMGVGFDIHSSKMHFYAILRRREDIRMGEAEYDCYSLEGELNLLAMGNKKQEEQAIGNAWTDKTGMDWIDNDAQGTNYKFHGLNDPSDMTTWDSEKWMDWWLEDPDNRHMPSWITGNPADGAGGYGPTPGEET
jgi:hypothetical protein